MIEKKVMSCSLRRSSCRAVTRTRPVRRYPACPDHPEKATLWSLLDIEKKTGITITESCAMLPIATISGWYFSYPDAKYFTAGQIDVDQMQEHMTSVLIIAVDR